MYDSYSFLYYGTLGNPETHSRIEDVMRLLNNKILPHAENITSCKPSKITLTPLTNLIKTENLDFEDLSQSTVSRAIRIFNGLEKIERFMKTESRLIPKLGMPLIIISF